MNQELTKNWGRADPKKRFHEFYKLLGKQAASYQEARHMGSNTSISSELAAELLRSVEYTLTLTDNDDNLSQALREGQFQIEKLKNDADQLLRLVEATAPSWQGEARWYAIRSLAGYLDRYDILHLAHRIPEMILYPVPMTEPEGMQGIHYALFYLRILWLENQIIACFQDDKLEELWSAFCQNDRVISENQCVQLLIQLAGKVTIGSDFARLLFFQEELDELERIDDIPSELCAVLMEKLKVTDPFARMYLNAVLCQLLSRWQAARDHHGLHNIFLSENQV